MACRWFNLPDGTTGVVCGGPRPKPCKVGGNCGARSVALCDWKLHQVVDGKRVYNGKTCDMPLCESHRTKVGVHRGGEHDGESKDLCPAHHRRAQLEGLAP
jgi:hypothetical protein